MELGLKDIAAIQPRLVWENHGIKIIDLQIGSILQSPYWISHREAWEAFDDAFPNIYEPRQVIMIDLNGKAYAVYD